MYSPQLAFWNVQICRQHRLSRVPPSSSRGVLYGAETAAGQANSATTSLTPDKTSWYAFPGKTPYSKTCKNVCSMYDLGRKVNVLICIHIRFLDSNACGTVMVSFCKQFFFVTIAVQLKSSDLPSQRCDKHRNTAPRRCSLSGRETDVKIRLERVTAI